jgi:hypothetical protein
MSTVNKLLFLLLCSGCASAGGLTQTPYLRSGEVELELRTPARNGTGWLVIVPGTEVSSDTEFSINLEVSQTAFVYVGQRTPGANVTVLYPPGDNTQLRAEPMQLTSLPESGQWFRLDSQVQDEQLLVLLSTRPQEVANARRLLGERGEAACDRSRDPPPQHVRERDRGKRVRGAIAEDGLAVLCFPLHHRP